MYLFIFIDSIIATSSPLATESPTLTLMASTNPAMPHTIAPSG